MNLDELTLNPGEWLRGTGPESDIVICSRIRLARNLADFPFSNRANRNEKSEIESQVRAAVEYAQPELSYVDVNALSNLDRQFLVERQLISRELAAAEGPLESIRGQVFAESLQDLALLQTLGVDPQDPLLSPLVDFDDYPKDEAWQQQARQTLLKRAK